MIESSGEEEPDWAVGSMKRFVTALCTMAYDQQDAKQTARVGNNVPSEARCPNWKAERKCGVSCCGARIFQTLCRRSVPSSRAVTV
jgi:hypothetical protein